jgi:hypothetical protein
MKDTTMANLLEGREGRASSALHWLFTILLLIGAVVLLISRISLTTENDRLTRDLARMEATLAETEASLKIALAGGNQVTERFPGMVVMKFNELIPLEADYARAILMIQPSYAGDQVRYQLLLENKSGDEVLPQITVQFFSSAGQQIAEHKVSLAPDGALTPGATRSVSGEFEDPAIGRAAFFRVQVS